MKKADAPRFLCVSDAESTGVDITQDRILTFYAMIQGIDGELVREQSWTINPGVEVPKGASDVHGMTTEWVREHGRKDVDVAIKEIAQFHIDAMLGGIPIVGFNHSYDLGLLDHEISRHMRGFALGLRGAQHFDPIVYDRAMDKYRKGGRKLLQVAAHYGITIDESRLHEAKYDVEVTARLAWILLKKSPYTLAQLQSLQLEWKRSWAEHLTEYFAKEDKTEEDGSPIIVDGSFPWRKD